MNELSKQNTIALNEASNVIWNSLSEHPSLAPRDGDLCSSYSCCKISSTNSCNLDSFPLDEPVLVYPGGESRCIFSTSTDYAFTVYRGDPSKVLFYFQGGGACFTEATTNLEFCTVDAVPMDSIGIFDRFHPDNPYSDFTIIVALYCSGDLFVGDVVRDYDDSAGQPVTQVGQINTQAVVDWVMQQQSSGQLPIMNQLVLSGCSAGSIGVQAWSDVLLSSFQYNHAALIADSYAGVFPEGTQGPLIYSYGMCPWLTDPALSALCYSQELTLQDITKANMDAFKSVPFSFIQSKSDDVQIAFYVAVAVSYRMDPAITPEEFYAAVNDMFVAYGTTERRRQVSNFFSYLLDGPVHCYTPRSSFYTADATGRHGNEVVGYSPDLATWVELMPITDEQDVHRVGGECWGKLQSKDNWAGIRYCAQELISRDFIQK